MAIAPRISMIAVDFSFQAGTINRDHGRGAEMTVLPGLTVLPG